MDGNALEVALALMRIPSMRVSLRLRPLPGNVGELIELAADVPGHVALAAARSGEPPQQVLEAARFYVREVLLFPGADAYRVLGVAETASDAQIKLHYRHLQHWLHPDRRGNDLESVFAARINSAWGELRSPARRAAYDARRRQAPPPTGAARPQRVLVSDWRPVAGSARPRREWMLFAGAAAGCLWLIVLIARQSGAPAPDWDLWTEVPAAAEQPLLVVNANAAVEQMQSRRHAAMDLEPVLPAMTLPATVKDPPAMARGAPESIPGRSMAVLATSVAQTPSSASGATEPVVVEVMRWQEEDPTAIALPALATPGAATNTESGRVASPAAAKPLPDLARLAHRCGNEVTQYLTSDSGHVPPIWHSIAAQDAAAAIRDRLHEGRTRRAGIHFGDPDWRIAREHASMAAILRRTERAEDMAQLRVEMTWRNGMWLVERIEVEWL